MNCISLIIKFIKFKPIIKLKKFKRHNYGTSATVGAASSVANDVTMRTRHRSSTSMYSLTFCIRFLLPERHKWKPAVQAAAVMLRTPPSPAGH